MASVCSLVLTVGAVYERSIERALRQVQTAAQGQRAPCQIIRELCDGVNRNPIAGECRSLNPSPSPTRTTRPYRVTLRENQVSGMSRTRCSLLNEYKTRVQKWCITGLESFPSIALQIPGKDSEMLFYSFFKTLVGQEVTVHLKNSVTLTGTLVSVDQFLNLKLDNLTANKAHPQLASHLVCLLQHCANAMQAGLPQECLCERIRGALCRTPAGPGRHGAPPRRCPQRVCNARYNNIHNSRCKQEIRDSYWSRTRRPRLGFSPLFKVPQRKRNNARDDLLQLLRILSFPLDYYRQVFAHQQIMSSNGPSFKSR